MSSVSEMVQGTMLLLREVGGTPVFNAPLCGKTLHKHSMESRAGRELAMSDVIG